MLVSALLVACANEPETRSQTVLAIDTDMPLAGAPSALRVAAMDTLRVEVLDRERGITLETRDFVLADPRDWPLSVGVVPPSRLRLRLFRARSPRAETTIDRLVDLDVAQGDDGVVRRRVLLSGDCLGRTVDLVAASTCVNADAPSVTATTGIDVDDGAGASAGTWRYLAPQPCSTSDDPEKPCIQGGFDVLGDVALAATPTQFDAPLPLRPVVVGAFRMDRTEFTVGRFNALVRSGYVVQNEMPSRAKADEPSQRWCTFRGVDDTSADGLPLNCASTALANELCAASGGRLPTEAEWEHAARGRGDGRAFPWGDFEPSCCTASVSRCPDTTVGAVCERSLVEPAGAHSASPESCPGGGDVSRDGVLDLGGSLTEFTRDSFTSVAECFAPWLSFDPVCMRSDSGAIVKKGADWTAGLAVTRSAYRLIGVPRGGSTDGFRCVYPEARP